MSVVVAVGIAWGGFGSVVYGEGQWPGFRGAGQSHARSTDVPLSWQSPGPARGNWTIRLPGYGQSSPVIWDDRIFVTAVSGPEKEHLHVLGINFDDGAVLWQRDFSGTQRVPDRDTVSRGAPTPVVDGDRLYCVFESGDVIALTHDGEPLWERSFVADYGELQGSHGYASSPIRIADLLVIQVAHSGPSYVLALDASTGETRWKVDHPSQTGWSSPAAFEYEQGLGVILSTAGSVRALDVRNGEEIWRVDGIQGNSTATPTVAGELVIIGVGEPRGGGGRREGDRNSTDAPAASEPAEEPGCMAIRLGGHGDVSQTHIAWKAPRVTSGYASPVVIGEAVYFVKKTGVVQAVDLVTGEPKWQRRLPGETWASPVAVGKHVMFFAKSGDVAALNTESEDQEMIESSLPATDVVYGVAAVNDSWIVRTGRGLLRIAAP